ncbi:MAG: hypothetical protein AAF810_14985 [Cyanobacteria bacterium P01_D01_bin.36]
MKIAPAGWLVIVLIVGVIGLMIYLDYRRTKAIKSVAETLGFTYCDLPAQYSSSVISHFDIGSKGRNRRLKNLIRGRFKNVKVAIGDYSYTTGYGKRRRTHSQTIAVIDADRTSFPKFVLVAENFLHKMGNALGFQDIDFHTHPEFSDRYWLAGPDENAIRDCFHSDVLNFFQDHNHTRFGVEGSGSKLIYYRKDQCFKPSEWRKLINSAYRVYQQF